MSRRVPDQGAQGRKCAVSGKYFRGPGRGTLARMKLVRLLPFAIVPLVLASSAAAGTTPQTIVVKVPAPATAAYNSAFTVARPTARPGCR